MTGSGIGRQAIGASSAAIGAGRSTSLTLKAVLAARAGQRACYGRQLPKKAQAVFLQKIPATLNACVLVQARHERDIHLRACLSHEQNEDEEMNTYIHGTIEARSGEWIEINFNVSDADGNAVDLTEASAEYRIARRAGDAALISRHSGESGGISIGDNIVNVTVDTAALVQGGKPLLGDFFAQLMITLDGRTLVAAEGPISISPVVLPAP